jgi:hypothetical protein
MNRRVDLATRGLGAEPSIPDLTDLSVWVASHRGTAADLTSFLIDQSLSPQVDAGIVSPCAGGKFMKNRLLENLIGIRDTAVIEEIGVRTEPFIEDAARIVAQKRDVWCALPAPSSLGVTDSYYHNNDDLHEAVIEAYRSILRAMRDGGVSGHVLICDKIEEEEIQMLARKNIFFFLPEPDRSTLEVLMEYQSKVAVPKEQVGTVLSLTGEYDIGQIIIVDPDPHSIKLALSHFDPDQVAGGGYCQHDCNEYWKTVMANSSFFSETIEDSPGR